MTQSSLLSARIRNYETNIEGITVYVIEIRNGLKAALVKRRYTDFANLYSILMKNSRYASHLRAYQFPPKSLIYNNSVHLKISRKEKFDQLLTIVLNLLPKLTFPNCISTFLEISQNNYMNNSIEPTSSSFNQLSIESSYSNVTMTGRLLLNIHGEEVSTPLATDKIPSDDVTATSDDQSSPPNSFKSSPNSLLSPSSSGTLRLVDHTSICSPYSPFASDAPATLPSDTTTIEEVKPTMFAANNALPAMTVYKSSAIQ